MSANKKIKNGTKELNKKNQEINQKLNDSNRKIREIRKIRRKWKMAIKNEKKTKESKGSH